MPTNEAAFITDASGLLRIIQEIQPGEIRKLAVQSHATISFEEPEYAAAADGLDVLRIVEASRLRGLVPEASQTRSHPFCPCSPVAKLHAYGFTANDSEAYDGIRLNDENAVHGETVGTRNIFPCHCPSRRPLRGSTFRLLGG